MIAGVDRLPEQPSIDADQLKTELPPEMLAAKRWLLWRSEVNGSKKPRKVPYYTNGEHRGATDTQADGAQLDYLDTALSVFSSGHFTGIGFALGSDGQGNFFQGIDFDNIDSHPTLFPILESLPGGYVEKSPSGAGYHIIGYGKSFNALASNDSGIEAYSKGRYFTVTGDSTDHSADICDLSGIIELLKPIHSPTIPQIQKEDSAIIVSPKIIIDLRSALNMLPFDDYGIWIAAGHALKELGDIGRSLWIDRSQQSDKWQPKDAKKWDTFKDTKAHYQFIFQEAQKLGWINPESHIAKPTIINNPNAIDFDLLENKNKKTEPWLIQADDFSEQPSPIKWLVKNWIPQDSTIMIHGPSGSGKTFFILDLAMRISGGIDKWGDSKVNQGSVVYLAGEGHYGIKGRVAAWKAHHSVDKLNMWISSSGCDLNTHIGYSLVAENIKTLSNPPALIVIDTLHRFLDGDENLSRDVKTILDACGRLTREFGAAVVLIHHTGIGESAKGRPRGSSAWRGGLDVEIGLSAPDHADVVKIQAIKVKDGRDGAELGGELRAVEIPGWIDEDGQPVSSCVFELCAPHDPSTPPPLKKPPKRLKTNKSQFEKSWWSTGAEVNSVGNPYVSRAGYKKYLEKEAGVSSNAAKNYCNETDENRPIGLLIKYDLIGQYAAGWAIIDDEWASLLLLSKNSKG